ncbi:MAG: enolase C-terminal domain-like protein, partial [Rhodospirillaceae bacterium]
LFGHKGLPLYAVSGLDMAYWDALAQAAGLPLARFLGGPMDPIPAYNSNGLGLTDDLGALADEARSLIAMGDFKAAKVRLGRDTLDADIAAFRAVRDAVGPDVKLPVDFNQGLDLEEALKRGAALDAEDCYWIEEAIVYDNMTGYAKMKAELKTPIQIGENFHGARDMSDALAADACTWVMPDLQRIGGVTGWRCAATIAEEAGAPMSSHIYPEVSAHVMAGTPTAHWLEYSDWAAPVMAEPLKIENGHAVIPDRPGTGVAWDEDAVKRYALEL